MLKRRFANIWERLTRDYRLVVYDNESLSQTRAVLVKPLTLWIVGISSVLVIAFLSGLVLAYFPAFQKSIPGLIVGSSSEYKELQAKNMELERQVMEMDSMLNVLHTAMGAGGKGLAASSVKMYEALPDEGEVLDDPSGPSHGSGTEAASPVSNGGSEKGMASPNVSAGSGQGAAYPNSWEIALLPPVKGVLTKAFDPKRKSGHEVEFATPEETMVRAVADGVVIYSDYSTRSGYVVGVWHHRLGLISYYKQVNQVLKPLGGFVFAGEAVAVAGSSGFGTQTSGLKFELWHQDHPVDPAAYMKLNQ